MSAGRFGRGALLGLALSVSFGALAIGERALVDYSARVAGPLVSRAAAFLAPAEPSEESSEIVLGQPAPMSLPYADALAACAPLPSAHTARASARRGIVVREAVVARAVASGGRPSGSPASASGYRPAGLVLQGISRFGSGLHDGDIVTQVGGASATSPGAVIAAVAGAVRSHARVLTAVVWRGEQAMNVAIELPRAR